MDRILLITALLCIFCYLFIYPRLWGGILLRKVFKSYKVGLYVIGIPLLTIVAVCIALFLFQIL